MPNLFTRILLFLSSYAPLLVILWMRGSFPHPVVSFGLLGVAIVSVAGLFAYLAIVRRLSVHPLRVAHATSTDGEAMSYIVTYLLPFLGADGQSLKEQLSLAVFFLMIGVLYVGSNLIHMNPVLNLVGYRLLEIESEGGKRSTLICRRHYIPAGATISVVSLTDQVVLEKTE